tara:strand:+ start:7035 stop:7514 length:480 start_codon:yes stop_codon:yes gene_type:complete
MPINIELKKEKNNDAQRQGHVGFDPNKIYDPSSVYAEDGNCVRVKNIFKTNFTDLSSQEIADAMKNRLSNQDYNPDFDFVSYEYKKSDFINKIRSEDLHNIESGEERKAPNVALPDSEEYVQPKEGNGGFGNDKFENSLHSESSEGEIDSLEILTKYSE